MFDAEIFKKAVEEVQNGPKRTLNEFCNVVAKAYVRMTISIPDIDVITPSIAKTQIKKLGLQIQVINEGKSPSSKDEILSKISSLEKLTNNVKNAENFRNHLEELKRLIERRNFKKAA